MCGLSSKGRAGCLATSTWTVCGEHDQDVGKLLKKVDDLGIADNTIVLCTTDNGPNMFSWPDAAMTPFRNEKNSNWEGAFRVPALIRWPGHIKENVWSNEIVSGLDLFPDVPGGSR
jgi:arylsulfatase